VSPVVMPVNVGDSLMRRVRPSAIIRKARGENGHPWGTPQLIEKVSLIVPLTLTLRLGGWLGLDRSVVIILYLGPKLRASSAWWKYDQLHLSNAFSQSRA
jgi:hypothetical protein